MTSGASAASRRATSAAVSRMSAAATFSSRNRRRLVPGIGTRSWPWCSTQASATCPGVAPSSVANLAHHAGGAHVGVEVGALEPGIVAAVVALGVLLGPPRRPGQKAAAERAERHQPDTELAQQRQDLRLEVPLPERVFALQRRDRVHRVGAPDGLRPPPR